MYADASIVCFTLYKTNFCIKKVRYQRENHRLIGGKWKRLRHCYCTIAMNWIMIWSIKTFVFDLISEYRRFTQEFFLRIHLIVCITNLCFDSFYSSFFFRLNYLLSFPLIWFSFDFDWYFSMPTFSIKLVFSMKPKFYLCNAETCIKKNFCVCCSLPY